MHVTNAHAHKENYDDRNSEFNCLLINIKGI